MNDMNNRASELEAEVTRLTQQVGEATGRIETDGKLIASLEAEIAMPIAAPLPAGVETTEARRKELFEEISAIGDPGNAVILAVLRDFDRLIAVLAAGGTSWQRTEIARLRAEIARLTAALAEAQTTEEDAMSRGHDVGFNAGTKVAEDASAARIGELEAEIARLTGALATMEAAAVRNGVALQAEAREKERETLLRDVQAMREQYAPLEEGESIMLDTLQDHVERRPAEETT